MRAFPLIAFLFLAPIYATSQKQQITSYENNLCTGNGEVVNISGEWEWQESISSAMINGLCTVNLLWIYDRGNHTSASYYKLGLKVNGQSSGICLDFQDSVNNIVPIEMNFKIHSIDCSGTTNDDADESEIRFHSSENVKDYSCQASLGWLHRKFPQKVYELAFKIYGPSAKNAVDQSNFVKNSYPAWMRFQLEHENCSSPSTSTIRTQEDEGKISVMTSHASTLQCPQNVFGLMMMMMIIVFDVFQQTQ